MARHPQRIALLICKRIGALGFSIEGSLFRKFDDLLFYDRGGGPASFTTMTVTAVFWMFSSHTNWRTTWRGINSGSFGLSGNYYGLMFYENGTGATEFYTTDGRASIVQEPVLLGGSWPSRAGQWETVLEVISSATHHTTWPAMTRRARVCVTTSLCRTVASNSQSRRSPATPGTPSIFEVHRLGQEISEPMNQLFAWQDTCPRYISHQQLNTFKTAA